MDSSLRRAICLGLLVSLLGLEALAAEQWKEFKSSSGFVVSYPITWFRKGSSRSRLMVLSSKDGVQGMIIARGQAMISVTEAEDSSNESLDSVIGHYLQDVKVLSRRQIDAEITGKQGCKEIQEVVSKESAVPPEDVPGPVPYIVNTEYFCEVRGHKYVTVLRNYDGDPQQTIYTTVAQHMAKSLRQTR